MERKVTVRLLVHKSFHFRWPLLKDFLNQSKIIFHYSIQKSIYLLIFDDVVSFSLF